MSTLSDHVQNPLPVEMLEQRMRSHEERVALDHTERTRVASYMVPYVEAELADARWSDAHALLRKHLETYRAWLST